MSAVETIRLEGQCQNWHLSANEDHFRRYFVVTVPFETAEKVFKAYVYDARTGRGEQRSEIDAHVKALKKAFLTNQFTPTAVSVGMYNRHLQDVLVKDGQAKVAVEPKDPLPLTDGHQRFGALRLAREEAREAGDADLVSRINAAPITALVHLDSDTQRDFIALQLGKSVDSSLLMSLKIQQSMFSPKDQGPVELARDIAKVLHTTNTSPFSKTVKFDTRGCFSLPITTLAAKGSSDLGTSLVGLAKVALSTGLLKCDPDGLADVVLVCLAELRDKAPELLSDGMLLSPPPEGGKGSATLLVGLGVCMAHRLAVVGRTEPSPEDLEALVHAAKFAFNKPVDGNLSGPLKRVLMGEFAGEFFGDVEDIELHQGVPLDLVHTLSTSTFNVSQVPKPKPAPKEKKPRVKSGKKTAADVPTAQGSVELEQQENVWDEVIDDMKALSENIRKDGHDIVAPGFKKTVVLLDHGVSKMPFGDYDEMADIPPEVYETVVKGFATGGLVRKPGDDTVPTMLDPGTSYLSKAVVEKVGRDKLERMNHGPSVLSGLPVEKLPAIMDPAKAARVVLDEPDPWEAA